MLPFYDLYRFRPEDFYNYEVDNIPIEQIETDLRYLDTTKANAFGSGTFIPIGTMYNNFFGYSQDEFAYLYNFSDIAVTSAIGYYTPLNSVSFIKNLLNGSDTVSTFSNISNLNFQFELQLWDDVDKIIKLPKGHFFTNYGTNSYFQNIKLEVKISDGTNLINSGNWITVLDDVLADDNDPNFNKFYISPQIGLGQDWNNKTEVETDVWYLKYDIPYHSDIDTNNLDQYYITNIRFTFETPIIINGEDIVIQELGYYNNSAEQFPHYVKKDIATIFDRVQFYDENGHAQAYMTQLVKESSEGGYDHSTKIVLKGQDGTTSGLPSAIVYETPGESASYPGNTALKLAISSTSHNFDTMSSDIINWWDEVWFYTNFGTASETQFTYQVEGEGTPEPIASLITQVDDGTLHENDVVNLSLSMYNETTHATETVNLQITVLEIMTDTDIPSTIDPSNTDFIIRTFNTGTDGEFTVGYMDSSQKYHRLFTVNENGIYDSENNQYVKMDIIKQLTRKTIVMSLPGILQTSAQPEPASAIISSVNGTIVKVQTYCEDGDGSITLTNNRTGNILTSIPVSSTVNSTTTITNNNIQEDDLIDITVVSSNNMSFATVQLIIEQDI